MVAATVPNMATTCCRFKWAVEEVVISSTLVEVDVVEEWSCCMFTVISIWIAAVRSLPMVNRCTGEEEVDLAGVSGSVMWMVHA